MLERLEFPARYSCKCLGFAQGSLSEVLETLCLLFIKGAPLDINSIRMFVDVEHGVLAGVIYIILF